MQFIIKHDGEITIINMKGDFLSEIDQGKLRDYVRKFVNGGKKQLVIDLTDVKHVNSCGLGALVCAFTSVRRAGGDLKLVGVGRTVGELLKITQLTMIFRICSSIEQAIAEFRN